MKNLGIVLIAGALALACITLTQAKTLALQNLFLVDQGGPLFLDTDLGSIEVESHEQGTVGVLVRRKSNNINDT